MRDPRAVRAVARLALLILAHAGQGVLGDVRQAAIRNEGAHAADGVRPATMAGAHQQLLVGAHEGDRHRHLRAIGKDHVGPGVELLDQAEDVVPASRVEARGVLPQLPEDLLHLERGEDRLDQDGGPDAAPRDAELLLRSDEDVVPEARLEVRLELGQVEVGSRATIELLAGVVEHHQPEVEEAGRDGGAIDRQVRLVQVPASRTDDERRYLGIQRVGLLIGLEGEAPAHRLVHCPLPGDHVVPGGGEGVLEIGHEDARAGVEGIDHHLRLDRPGDLHPPVVQVCRGRCDPPGRVVADRGGLGQEAGELAGVEAALAFGAGSEQLQAARVEGTMQAGHERDGRRGEDLARVRRVEACPVAHQPPASRSSRWSTRAATARR